MFFRPQSSNSCLTEHRNHAATRERHEQVKRQSFFNVAISDWITEIVWQVTTYSKIFSKWLSPPDPWKNHNMPANHATAGLQRGSFRATRSQNGKRPRPGFPSMGSWETSVNAQLLRFLQRLKFFLFVAGAGKSVLWYVKLLIFPSRNLSCWPAPQSSRTLMPCGKLGSRH
jgi:hypothetical protein